MSPSLEVIYDTARKTVYSKWANFPSKTGLPRRLEVVQGEDPRVTGREDLL